MKIPKEFSFCLRGLFENGLARIPLNSGSILNVTEYIIFFNKKSIFISKSLVEIFV
jgi:hypothetical protein